MLINSKRELVYGPFKASTTSVAECQRTSKPIGIKPQLFNITLTKPDLSYTGIYKVSSGNQSLLVLLTSKLIYSIN